MDKTDKKSLPLRIEKPSGKIFREFFLAWNLDKFSNEMDPRPKIVNFSTFEDTLGVVFRFRNFIRSGINCIVFEALRESEEDILVSFYTYISYKGKDQSKLIHWEICNKENYPKYIENYLKGNKND